MPFKPIFKTLPRNQRRAWPHLGPAKDLGFCLYGGTALALRFGHRVSVDFDFFSAEALSKSSLMAKLPFLSEAEILQESRNSYVFMATAPGGRDPVKISFFAGLSFGRIAAPELSDDGVLLAASIKDLMATKLKVLFDRVEPRDYIDIAEMLGRGVSLSDGIRDALALFPKFNPIACLKVLCYFDSKELAGLAKNCKLVLTKAVISVASTTRSFSPSAIVSPSLVLSPKDMACELSLVRPAPAAASAATHRRLAPKNRDRGH